MSLARILDGWTTLRPHRKQTAACLDVWLRRHRIVHLPCGRGSGKTEISRRVLVVEALKQHAAVDPRYFYAAPTLKHAWELAWDALLRMIPGHLARAAPGRNSIFLSNGVRVVLVGLNDKKRSDIEGFQWDGGVVDESCDITPGLFGRIIIPALTHKLGWCLRIGAPKRQGVGAAEYRKACEDAAGGLIPGATTYAWPASDILPDDVLAQARAVLDPKDYAEQFDATWQTSGGGVFYAFDRAYNVRPCPYRPDRPLVIGMDFNVDPMAWVVAHRWGDRFEVIDELWLRNTNTPAALDVLWSRYASHTAGFEFYGDAASQQRRTSASLSDYQLIASDRRFKPARVFFPAGNPPVADRFASTNAMFRNAQGDIRLFVDPACTHLLWDIEARHYAPGSREPEDGGDIGHITDAMSYAVHYLYPISLDDPIGSVTIGTTRGAL